MCVFIWLGVLCKCVLLSISSLVTVGEVNIIDLEVSGK